MLKKSFFVVCYQTEWRIARWVSYFLTASDLDGDAKRKDNFHEDLAIEDESLRSKPKDYTTSGYARGHQAPAEDFTRSVVAMSTTFVMSNMAPQTVQLNSGKWRSLENELRTTVRAHLGVWVFTGSLFVKEARERGSADRHFSQIDPLRRPRTNKDAWVRGEGRVAVPTHSYKAVLVARQDSALVAYGFILPNQRERLPAPVNGYQVSVADLEQLTGVNFFAALDDEIERSVEKATPPWPPKREIRR